MTSTPISAPISVEQATQALRSILDPETGRTLVTEGWVRKVRVEPAAGGLEGDCDAEREGGCSGEAVDVGEDRVLHGRGLSHELCSRFVLAQVPYV